MLKKSKVAIFSDLHLGIHNNSEDWHKIALWWADWIVKELTEKKIKDIFFLGDFFDNRSEISVQTLHLASEILNKFKDFNMLMIIGNHDAFYKNRSDIHSMGLASGHPNITIVDKNFEFEDYGKKFAFVPWNNELPDGKFDYIFGHFEIVSFKMNNFKVCDHGLSPIDFLGSKTDSVFSGHFHRRSMGSYNEGRILYVGNTFPMDFADVDNTKGYHILDVETGGFEFFENTISPKFKKFNLSKIKSITEDYIKNNIVKMVVDMEVDDKKLDKFRVYLNKFRPYRLIIEHNVVKSTIDSVEEIDAINIPDMMDEFVVQLKLEEEQEGRVDDIIKELYERNK
jgi:DNA repair exonuclease SbcCD nuclease subunit